MDNQPYYEEQENMSEDQVKELERKAEVVNKLLVGTFETALGRKCLEHLEKTFVDRDVYHVGMSFEQTAHRAGQASVVREIRKALEGALNGR